jgi:hypothetical protein
MKVKHLLDILSQCDLDAEVCLEPHNYDQDILRIEYNDPKLRTPNTYKFKGIVWISNSKAPMGIGETCQKVEGLDDDTFWIT